MDLSSRVGELFMLDNDFFQSPFMRDKIPRIMFSNGRAGLEALEFPIARRAASTNVIDRIQPAEPAMVRRVPIQVESTSSAPTSGFTEISSVRNSTPTFESSLHSKLNSFSPTNTLPSSLPRPQRPSHDARNDSKPPRPKFSLGSIRPPTMQPAMSGPQPSMTFSMRESSLQPTSSLQSLPSLNRSNRDQPLSTRATPKSPFWSRTTSIPDLAREFGVSAVEIKDDPVDEVIRSLEAFDPSDLMQRFHSVSSPNLVPDSSLATRRHPSLNSLATKYENVGHKKLPHLAELIRLNCLKTSQMALKPGWRSFGELEMKMDELKDTFFIIHQKLSDILEIGHGFSSDYTVQRTITELQFILNQLNSIKQQVHTWTSKKLWRGAWTEAAEDDLDFFVRICNNLPDALENLLSSLNGSRPHLASNHASSLFDRDTSSFSLDRKHQKSMPTLVIDRQPYQMLSVPDVMDGGESTTSSADSSSQTLGDNSKTSRDTLTVQQEDLNSVTDSNTVIEEDDLMSVTSETSQWNAQPGKQDYRPNNHATPPTLTTEDREMLEFFGPQIRENADKVVDLVRDLFDLIENGLPPEKFLQKVKMIVMTAKLLLQLASNVGHHMQSAHHRTEFIRIGERLKQTVNYCEETAVIAHKQYPSAPAMQSLTSAVNSVSQQAQDLKIILTLATFRDV